MLTRRSAQPVIMSDEPWEEGAALTPVALIRPEETMN